MPRHPKKHLPKFDPENGTLAEDHISKFYLALQIMIMKYDEVACRLFPHTLENKVATLYHSLPMAFIRTWQEFWRTFIENLSEYNMPSMLLNEFNTLKFHKKDKVKYSNQ